MKHNSSNGGSKIPIFDFYITRPFYLYVTLLKYVETSSTEFSVGLETPNCYVCIVWRERDRIVLV